MGPSTFPHFSIRGFSQLAREPESARCSVEVLGNRSDPHLSGANASLSSWMWTKTVIVSKANRDLRSITGGRWEKPSHRESRTQKTERQMTYWSCQFSLKSSHIHIPDLPLNGPVTLEMAIHQCDLLFSYLYNSDNGILLIVLWWSLHYITMPHA